PPGARPRRRAARGAGRGGAAPRAARRERGGARRAGRPPRGRPPPPRTPSARGRRLPPMRSVAPPPKSSAVIASGSPRVGEPRDANVATIHPSHRGFVEPGLRSSPSSRLEPPHPSHEEEPPMSRRTHPRAARAASIAVLVGVAFIASDAPGRAQEPITRMSVDSAGAQAFRESESPAISADGRYVAFASLAKNLVPGDTNGRWDIFVHERATGVTVRVSLSSG